MIRTNRMFIDVETKDVFRLFHSTDNACFKLISDGNENMTKGTQVNGFYISAVAVKIKINGTKIIDLKPGYFYNLKEDEIITHSKYATMKKFTKVN